MLTTKLFCGECGKLMAGESGTSCTGQKYRYYKCHNAKKKKGCTKRAVKKDWIENLVVEQTMKLVFDDEIISRITDKIMEIQGEESYDVQILEKHLAETNRSIQNIMKAIEAGIFTETTKQRLEELEAEKASTEDAIAKARIESPIVSREEISFYLSRFRNTDITDEQSRQRLIDCFVNAVYVYDDRIVLTFNYKDATKTISLDEVNSSDLESSCPPKETLEIIRISRVFCFLFSQIFSQRRQRKAILLVYNRKKERARPASRTLPVEHPRRNAPFGFCSSIIPSSNTNCKRFLMGGYERRRFGRYS